MKRDMEEERKRESCTHRSLRHLRSLFRILLSEDDIIHLPDGLQDHRDEHWFDLWIVRIHFDDLLGRGIERVVIEEMLLKEVLVEREFLSPIKGESVDTEPPAIHSTAEDHIAFFWLEIPNLDQRIVVLILRGLERGGGFTGGD
jgi:hypothetical protein